MIYIYVSTRGILWITLVNLAFVIYMEMNYQFLMVNHIIPEKALVVQVNMCLF